MMSEPPPDHPTLEPAEARVLGVLVEKSLTTPGQYPLTLNALVSGVNQKSNRDPVLRMSEDDVFDALGGLRHKGLAAEVLLSGSRVSKYRHYGKDALGIPTSALAVLAELLLRGPQSVGELRSRTARMHPTESLDALEGVLHALMERDPPLVEEHPPPPGSRARRYVQLLRPALHPIVSGPTTTTTTTSTAAAGGSGAAPQPAGSTTMPTPDLAARIDGLERELADLRDRIDRLESGSSHGDGPD